MTRAPEDVQTDMVSEALPTSEVLIRFLSSPDTMFIRLFPGAAGLTRA
jgi:hypothetical protein